VDLHLRRYEAAAPLIPQWNLHHLRLQQRGLLDCFPSPSTFLVRFPDQLLPLLLRDADSSQQPAGVGRRGYIGQEHEEDGRVEEFGVQDCVWKGQVRDVGLCRRGVTVFEAEPRPVEENLEHKLAHWWVERADGAAGDLPSFSPPLVLLVTTV
jgi:hypothetical protein